MKKNYLILCALLFCFSVSAQQKGPDKIQKKDNTVVDAVVIEISSKEVKYKKFKSPQGATFSIPTKDVSTIVYADGYIEIMDEPPPVVVKNSTVDVVTEEKNPVKTVSNPPAPASETKPSEAASVEAKAGSKSKEKKDKEVLKKTKDGGFVVSNKQVGLELPPKEMSGLDITRVPFDMLEADLRHPSEYDGEYQWKASNHDQKGTIWRIDWDNVTLIPKEWMGYGWQKRANSEREIKLKNNELRVNGKVMGHFMKFSWKGKEVRGFYIQTENNRDLFLLKVK